MRAYQKPTMDCEVFAANEFIAACESYFVGCLIEPGTKDTTYYGVHNAFDDGTGCCHYKNQVATLGSGGVVTVKETNAPNGQGVIVGTDCSWVDSDGDGAFSTGDQVNWTTADSSGQQYAHVGQLYSRNSS